MNDNIDKYNKCYILSFACSIVDYIVDSSSSLQSYVEKYLLNILNPNDIIDHQDISNYNNAIKEINTYQLGGCSLNTLRMYTYLHNIFDINFKKIKDINTSNFKTCFICSIGDDSLSNNYINLLKQENILCIYQKNSQSNLSSCLVNIDKQTKDKIFYNNISTCKKLSKSFLTNVFVNINTIKFNNIEVDINNLKYFLLDSYLIKDCFEEYLFIYNYIIKKNKFVKFVYNLADVYFINSCFTKVDYLVNLADIVVCNEDQISSYIKLKSIDKLSILCKDSICNDVVSSILNIVKDITNNNTSNIKLFIITRGNKPTLSVYYSSKEFFSLTVDVNKININNIVDTNGAGDSFTAGFLFALDYYNDSNNINKDIINKDLLTKCINFGHSIAELSLLNKGFSIEKNNLNLYIKTINKLINN